MEIRQSEMFRALAEELHFTRAAAGYIVRSRT
jgi:DNA-binding transcriptional LysR family regulator